MATVTRKLLVIMAVTALASGIAGAGQWTALGPEGGDVRSLAHNPANPDHILLGTSSGALFTSRDGGRSWTRFAHLGPGDDYVLDHVVFDPQNPKKIYVSAWSFQNQQAGDIFRTHDGGKNWETLPAMHGKSVRALAIAPPIPRCWSQAPSMACIAPKMAATVGNGCRPPITPILRT